MLLEFFNVVLPLGFDVVGVFPGFNHLSDVGYTDEFFKEWGEETVADVEAAIGFDEVT